MSRKQSKDFVCIICLKQVDVFNVAKSHFLLENFLKACFPLFGIDAIDLFKSEEKKSGLRIWKAPLLCKGCEKVLNLIRVMHVHMTALEKKLFGGIQELGEILNGTKTSLPTKPTNAVIKRLASLLGGVVPYSDIKQFREELLTSCEAHAKKDTRLLSFGKPVPQRGLGVCREDITDTSLQEAEAYLSGIDLFGDTIFNQTDDNDSFFGCGNITTDDGLDIHDLYENEPVSAAESGGSESEDSEEDGDSESGSSSGSTSSGSNKVNPPSTSNTCRRPDICENNHCALCNKNFFSYIRLMNHEKEEHSFEFQLCTNAKCHKCELLLSPLHLYNHLASVHNESWRLQCEICQETLPDCSELYRHLQSAHGKDTNNTPIMCVYCDQEFPLQQLRELHRFLKHYDKPQLYNCEVSYCDGAFSTVQKLNEHFSEKHSYCTVYSCDKCGIGYLSEHYVNLHKISHVKVGETLKFQCLESNCKSGFYQKPDLYNHFNYCHGGSSIVHLLKCNKCTSKCYTFSAKEFEVHLETHNWGDRKTFLCLLCGEDFPVKELIQRHVVEEHGQLETSPVFECELCNKEFSSKKSLQGHKRSVHRERSEVCPECGKAFRSKYQLDFHIRSIHAREFVEICDQCGKSFTTRNALNEHVKMVHTETSGKFECPVCFKKIKRRRHLEVHMKTHSTERMHPCRWCDFKARISTSLLPHVRQKHPEHAEEFKKEVMQVRESKCITKCDQCGKQFTSDKNLKLHARIHDKIRFQCEQCPKNYLSKANLDLHMKEHTGYNCYWCNLKYTKSGSFTTHVRRKHPEHFHELKDRLTLPQPNEQNEDEDEFRTPIGSNTKSSSGNLFSPLNFLYS